MFTYLVNSAYRVYQQLSHLHGLVFESDIKCLSQLRMDRQAFFKLCKLLCEKGSLVRSKRVSPEEMVAMFLSILAHHVKNRVVGFNFKRSRRTVSKCFHECLRAMIRCQKEFWKKPEPITNNSTDPKWKWFTNCLGALDGTYIKVHVSEADKPRYRTRKNEIATNVLGVCSQDMQFIYVLPGWESSTHDMRVLKDALTRRNGLKVPHGYYYLVDAGYTNGMGFLSPYRGERYHLSDFRDGHQPHTPKEFFNMKHSSARNVIEQCFGILKKRWAVLRSPAFYDIITQRRIISVCCMLHNFIRTEMSIDVMEEEIDDDIGDNVDEAQFIESIDTSNEWSAWRDNLAQEMWNMRNA
ncbi:DDE Tnp4 domain-containing protein [Citrus sinensis]|uniref:protein ALP1-like n=1 Tax=Citrus clementina TaxID=85681 RepID=UPI000CED29D1|nr:protein ALP1-like [Citrus x clementina]XP_052293255.1 protein ALP1-like isoform X1 [Citrus sinensis]KAH9730551.1 DDE Tnp4 domain-containing protein [Citrus sinensis]